jgi:alkaline phosphatase
MFHRVAAASAMILTAMTAASPTRSGEPARSGEITQAGDPYYLQGQAALAERLAIRPIVARARNVILFIADGNGVASNTAIRIADGQKRGESGEGNVLVHETFPYLALSKTYNTDAQIPDSAGTATAILSGVKTRKGVIGVSQEVVRGDCASALANPVATLGELAEARGMATGIVTTARLTHATPAAFYAHSADRDWEDDTSLPQGVPCDDIARQLIAFPFEVAMGGGRRHFLPEGVPGIEGVAGLRQDERDLVAEWRAGGPGRVVVQTRTEFDQLLGGLGGSRPERVLGLFNPLHMSHEVDRPSDRGGEPSLAEMTGAAIDVLRRDGGGYFLLVEGGLIDHAYHNLDLHRAVTDGLALNEAVRVAAEVTDAADTLIIVTSDHVNQMRPWSYGPRGAPVVDFDDWRPADHPPTPEGSLRRGPWSAVTDLIGLVFGTAPPAGPGSHGAADVAIYARGPMAHLVGGTVEQHYIFHVISHALGLSAVD